MTDTDDRLNRLEDQMIDMRLAVSALLETVTQHQRNFETIQRNFERISIEIRDMKIEIRDLRTDTLQIQSEVRGLQTENRRILDILQDRRPDEDDESA